MAQSQPAMMSSAPQQITETGCVQKESDHQRAPDAGRGGFAGTGVASASGMDPKSNLDADLVRPKVHSGDMGNSFGPADYRSARVCRFHRRNTPSHNR